MPEIERLWIDFETTGLGEKKEDVPLELAMIVTDKFGDEIARKQSLIYPVGWRTFFSEANKVVRDMHIKSGLFDELMALVGDDDHTIMGVENKFVLWLEDLKVKPNTLPMCGRSVHFDRRFMLQFMPKLHDYFHYRNIDVSTIQGLARDLNPAIFEAAPKTRGIHRSIPDLEDTLDQYKFYLDEFLLIPSDM